MTATDPRTLKHLLDFNRAWAERTRTEKPEFFEQQAASQTPDYLWIGCADSRVPPYLLTGLMIGEVFVHRNIANLVVHSDLNCLSVMQFAIDVLKVRHIMVVGHYGCSGVSAALNKERHGLVDNWLRHIRDVRDKHRNLVSDADPVLRLNRLCELNVIEQVNNVCQTLVVQDAWSRGQELSVHGWVYNIHNVLLIEAFEAATSESESASNYEDAIRRIAADS